MPTPYSDGTTTTDAGSPASEQTEAPAAGLLEIPLPAEGQNSTAWWLEQIQAAKDKRDKISREYGWKDRIASYLGRSLSAVPTVDTVVVPKDYANVEQKKAQLFTQVPELHLEPKRDEFASAAPIAQAIVRDYLGPNKVNASTVMNEVIFDALCPSGLMCSKVGYEAIQDGVKPVPMGPPDPITGQQMTVPAPNIIYERYFWERFSPLKSLIPADFHGSDYDKAPWLGFEFEFDPTDQTGLNPNEIINERGKSSDKQSGVEIWYRASVCDPANEKHPEKFRCLVFKNGQPVKHAASPYQRIGADGTILGMRRNPVRIGALRYVSDSAYPPSDCQMSQPQVEELSKGRSQMIQQRNYSIPLRGADRTRIDKDTLDKLTNGPKIGDIILTEGNPSEIVMEMARAQFPRENFTFDQIINRDLANTWGLTTSPGEEIEGTKTATEASIFQGKADVRLRKERQMVLNYFLQGAEQIFALIQLFADDTDYVKVVGQDGLAKLVPWNKQTIPGDYMFTAKPDSAVYQDQALQRKRATETYQFLAPNKFVNQNELTRWFLQQQDMEPAKFLAPPPKPEPEKPSISFAFKGEDLNPALPQFGIVAYILQTSGMPLPPELVQMAQMTALVQPALGPVPAPPAGHPPHQTGTAPMQHPINKHQSEESGRLPGGGMAPAVN